MRAARARVSLEFFIQICKQTESPVYTVVDHALPDDAEVVSCEVISFPNATGVLLELLLVSETFADVAEGDEFPLLPPTQFQRVIAGSGDESKERKVGE